MSGTKPQEGENKRHVGKHEGSPVSRYSSKAFQISILALVVFLAWTPWSDAAASDEIVNRSEETDRPDGVFGNLRKSNKINQAEIESSAGRPKAPFVPKFDAFVDLYEDSEENQKMDLTNDDARLVARQVMERIGSGIEDRMTSLFEKAKTPECRLKIGEHFGYFLSSIGEETNLPYANLRIRNECPEDKYDFKNLPENVTIGDIQNRTYQPPPSKNAVYIGDPSKLNLLFAILTHEQPESTIRLIESLHESGHLFVIHVDGKEASDETQRVLRLYSETHPHVHVLPDDWRVRVNWGGANMVRATLQMLKYAFAVDRPAAPPLKFHKIVHMASTSYPTASNTRIREKIAGYPLDANLMHVVFKPTDPGEGSWQYFVECDDAVHRIYRLPPLSERKNGIDLYTSSQWFIISREFGVYLAKASRGSMVQKYLEYVEHVVVADETFFGTVLRHTKFCEKHHNENFLHLQFDRWENEIDAGRDARKCLMPDPEHCGRSPTTMTMDYLPVLELSHDLFARKFHDDVDSRVKDVIDEKRKKEEEIIKMAKEGTPEETDKNKVDTSFEGHGVLIVARETLYDKQPLCFGIGTTKNKVKLTPCFYEDVPPTLASEWETGAVILQETAPHNRWEVGPCSTDGSLQRMPNGTMQMGPGVYSKTGPLCKLKMMDGIRSGRCVDAESDRVQPGGELQVFPCTKRWNQLFSFGGETLAPRGSLHTSVPLHVQERIHKTGREQAPYMCIGVLGRGKLDEEDWEEDLGNEYESESVDTPDNEEESISEEESNGDEEGIPPLRKWEDDQLVTTRCDNVDGVIEWVFIPFIEEAEAMYMTNDEENNDKESEDYEDEEEL